MSLTKEIGQELEYNLRGFLTWTCGNKYAKVNVLLRFLCEKGGYSSSVLSLGDQ